MASLPLTFPLMSQYQSMNSETLCRSPGGKPVSFLSKLCCWRLSLCLKEDGDGPGGVLHPLDLILESVLLKDSFCLYFFSIPYFPQWETECTVIYKTPCCSIWYWLSKGWASVSKDRGVLWPASPSITSDLSITCAATTKCASVSGSGLFCPWWCTWI